MMITGKESAPRCALTIAGSDPTGGAGIQADLKTFAALGVYGLSIISSITAQNSLGVRAIHPVPLPFIRGQLESLLVDFRIDALKIGMVYQPDIIEELARLIRKYRLGNLILDPVARASRGGELLARGGMDALREMLLPLATLVTPNLDEAGLLAGRPMEDLDAMHNAAEEIRAMGGCAVLIKGGHLKGEITDLFFDGTTYLVTRHEKRAGDVRGTGCTLSAAIAAGLAQGLNLSDAVSRAQRYTQAVIKGAFSFGKQVLYPDHFVRERLSAQDPCQNKKTGASA